MSYMWKRVKEIKVKIRCQCEIKLNPVQSLLSGHVIVVQWYLFTRGSLVCIFNSMTIKGQ